MWISKSSCLHPEQVFCILCNLLHEKRWMCRHWVTGNAPRLYWLQSVGSATVNMTCKRHPSFFLNAPLRISLLYVLESGDKQEERRTTGSMLQLNQFVKIYISCHLAAAALIHAKTREMPFPMKTQRRLITEWLFLLKAAEVVSSLNC